MYYFLVTGLSVPWMPKIFMWDHPYREHVHQHQHQHPNTTFLPCRWHTQNGQRITSFTQLTDPLVPIVAMNLHPQTLQDNMQLW